MFQEIIGHKLLILIFPPIVRLERQAGGVDAIKKAADLLSNAKFPVILSGAGVVIGGAIEDCKKLAEKLDAPVCSGYQHNDSFPGSHPLAAGPLGYNGSKAGMELIKKADVVLALWYKIKSFLNFTWLWNGLLAKRCKYYSS